MCTGILWTLSSTMLQILTPDRMRGRIFAIDFGTNTVTTALSTFLVGVMLERWDPRVVRRPWLSCLSSTRCCGADWSC
jgi:hypothetical protein